MTSLRTSLLALAATAAAVALGLLDAGQALALDPPHDDSNGVECLSCHDPHTAAGGKLNIAEFNPNVCMTCHTSGGLASAFPVTDSDQALPGVRGTFHRFDSGPSGHAEPSISNTSTGRVVSQGTFTGRVEREYDITITASGNVGSATFSWADDVGGSGTATTGTSVSLSGGLSARFENGDNSPSFISDDTWTIYVRNDLRLPSSSSSFEYPMYGALDTYSKVACSTCHNQHSQENTPADPSAPAYAGTGTGEGRHYQRVNNDSHQMCLTCHGVRDVTSSSQGSHPVNVTIPTGTGWTPPPSSIPLWGAGSDRVYCLSCHYPHWRNSGGANGGAGDGYLLNDSITNLCFNCHDNADRTNGSHFNTSTGALWPGGQYGSTKPASPSWYKGYCVNCHWPHGWDDDSNTDTQADYPRLWNEQYDIAADRSDPDDAEDLCFTCHDASPATSDIKSDIEKGTNGTLIYHHPVKDSQQSSGRSVECVDCHNPHKATNVDRHAGVSGVNINGGTIAAGSATLKQQELCFKCHGDSYNSSRSMTSNKRLDFGVNNSAYHPVVQAGRNQSANLTSSLSGASLTTSSTIRCTDCHNSNAFSGTTGTVTDSTSVTVGPHGSTYAPILRANFILTYTSSSNPSSWSANNFQLCFRCHDQTRLITRKWEDGARTNFFDNINGKDNLHWLHLQDKISSTRASCLNCHFDIHSNISAANTQYRINGVLYADNAAVSAARYKTHMVNFSPDITAYGGRSKPEWYLTTSTRERRCYLTCHGETMADGSSSTKVAYYRPPSGDETTWTY